MDRDLTQCGLSALRMSQMTQFGRYPNDIARLTQHDPVGLCALLAAERSASARPLRWGRIFFGPQEQRRLSGVCSLGGAVIPMVGR
jgi:hypothetical protein